ncbi:hypothetical protein GCM10009780_00140 [Actinomadura alba]
MAQPIDELTKRFDITWLKDLGLECADGRLLYPRCSSFSAVSLAACVRPVNHKVRRRRPDYLRTC